MDSENLGRLVDIIYDDIRINLLNRIGAKVRFWNYEFQDGEFSGTAKFYFEYEQLTYTARYHTNAEGNFSLSVRLMRDDSIVTDIATSNELIDKLNAKIAKRYKGIRQNTSEEDGARIPTWTWENLRLPVRKYFFPKYIFI